MSDTKFDVTKISISCSGKVKLEDQSLIEIEKNAFEVPVGGTGLFNSSSECQGANLLFCNGDMNSVCTNYLDCDNSSNSQSCRNQYCEDATNAKECV
jgi:hypothetical protein